MDIDLFAFWWQSASFSALGKDVAIAAVTGCCCCWPLLLLAAVVGRCCCWPLLLLVAVVAGRCCCWPLLLLAAVVVAVVGCCCLFFYHWVTRDINLRVHHSGLKLEFLILVIIAKDYIFLICNILIFLFHFERTLSCYIWVNIFNNIFRISLIFSQFDCCFFVLYTPSTNWTSIQMIHIWLCRPLIRILCTMSLTTSRHGHLPIISFWMWPNLRK